MKKFTNKFLSILMCLTMILTIAPIGSFAVEVSATADLVNNSEMTSDIRAGETITINIVSNNITYIRFIPEVSGIYTFSSNSSSDTYGYLYDADKNQITYNDDDGDGNNFSITYELQSGVVYYWGARFYSSGSSGSFDVTLVCDEAFCAHENTTAESSKEASCSEDGYTAGVYCNDCKLWIEGHKIIEAGGHTDENVDGICDACKSDVPILAEGSCGTNLVWTLYETGMLEITGDGDMTNWSPYYDVTWYSYVSSIKTVNIGNSVTSIGDCAFYNCTGLTSITIGNSVTSIGSYAFYNCDGLTSITIPDSVISTGSYAFYYCDNLKDVYYEASISDWKEISIGSGNSPLTSAKRYYKECGTCGDNLTWTLDTATGVLDITGTGDMTNWSSNSAVPWYAYRLDIKTVNIGNSVTSIGDYAFYGCAGLKTVYYESSKADWRKISIGSNNSPLTSAERYYKESGTCGDNLTWILDTETGVLEITGEGDMTNWSSASDVPWYSYYRTSIKTVNIANLVTSIGNYAFFYCTSLTSVTIPDSVTGIGDYAFYGCTKLTSITIPDSVTSIGDYAFCDCSGLKDVYITDIAAWCKIIFGRYYANPMYYGDNLYLNGELVTNLVIPEAVTSIGYEVFYSCDNLISITIPDSVTSIGDSAFEDCDSLTSVTIGNSVTSIGNYAFYYCDSLTSITIPDSVTSISDWAFNNTAYYNDDGNWKDGVLYIGNHLIEAKTTISGAYTIKSGTKTIADFAFSGCTDLTSITIPASVTSIGGYTFAWCDSLTSITIPDSVTKIGDWAFGYCDSLTSITIPDSVICIGYEAFNDTAYYNDDSNWTDGVLYIGNYLIEAKTTISGAYTIKSGTKTITDDSFYGCTKLTSITIPDSVTIIGDWAFGYCDSLTNITIPDSVTSIGDFAFNYCYSLSKVYYESSEADWNKISIGTNNSYFINATIYYNCHEHSHTETVTKEPTCTQTGMKTVTCIRGESYEDVIPALGHAYERIETVEPTCTEDGYNIYRCTRCADEKTETIFTSGHDYVHIGTIAPTCTKIGMYVYKCSICNEYYRDPIEMKEHSYNKVDELNATCTQEGYATFKCSVCGTERTDITSPLGHTHRYFETIEPTCTEEGYDVYKCTRCEDKYTITISATGHSYVYSETIEPTCTELGMYIYKCSGCNDSINEPIDMIEHEYNEKGICVGCGKLYNISVPEGVATVIDKEKNLISGLEAGLDVDSFINCIAFSDDMAVELDRDIIGTGTKVKVIDKATSEIIEEYTLVIFGDYNGDGVADIEDTGYFASISNFEIFDYFEYDHIFMAADINGDGVVDVMDEEDMYAVANYEAYIDYTITEGSKVIRY